MLRSSSNEYSICRRSVLAGFVLIALFGADQSSVRAVRQQSELHVKAEEYGFIPAFVTIPAGTTVTWTNLDPELHTVTGEDGGFDGSIGPGETFSLRFHEPGVFFYYCQPHDWMIGEITVISATGR
jgi:plastocyanin